ncbi:endolytic transglycosylase MltG [Echinicola strongylocentroti]|uniref:Endolytic murein transglycosylase n=1 Tax=Echinicola strongylocentroti TaxID=1795355 RepID=A0A2Z4IHV2_9BACT|nr:endolytic transglycosylase MltG [Echinicola strongylocentroti]AWW30136.1 endolytic transglycosylase MltG [Echinicola strongylocentroti]
MITKKNQKYYMIGMIAVSVLVSSFAFYFYQVFFSPNTLTESDVPAELKIPSNATFQQVSDSLASNEIITDVISFSFVSKVLKYQENVKPGRYIIQPKMSNKELVSLLRSGRQTPVNLTFNNIRTKEDLSEKITDNLEINKDQFLSLLQDSVYIRKFDFNEETIMSMFIPNTYEVYWNISPETLFDRMYREYNKFWTKPRIASADSLGMSRTEVATLASIVQAETAKKDERPKIAGVYINRLERNIPLQADPTLVFALGDFSIKRVLNVHKEIDSPYNTYLHTGLPPGPINLPDISSLDAVLHYDQHNYLYFCAKEDFSGYHVFSTNLRDHLIQARKYQNALNQANVY